MWGASPALRSRSRTPPLRVYLDVAVSTAQPAVASPALPRDLLRYLAAVTGLAVAAVAVALAYRSPLTSTAVAATLVLVLAARCPVDSSRVGRQVLLVLGADFASVLCASLLPAAQAL